MNYLKKDSIKNVLVSEEQIEKRVIQIAKEIDKLYKDEKEPIIIIGVLKGSFIFLSDLSRKLMVPHIVDFIALSSYGKKRGETGGNVRFIMDTREDLEGKNIVIVEDILDTGHTLNYLINNIKARGCKSLKTVVLLNKPNRRVAKVDIDFVGFEIPDEWVVGYGLDYMENFRTLPYIAALDKEKL